LPVGILALTLAFLFLPQDQRTARGGALDTFGFLLLSPALVLFLYGTDHVSERVGLGALLLALVLFCAFLWTARKQGRRALIDLELFRTGAFSASARTQFLTNGLSFAGQMLVPVFLIRAAGESPSATGWLMAPLGLGMMCTYVSLGRLTQRFGIKRTATAGALIALLGTVPFVYLAKEGLNVVLLTATLFVRGMGMSAVGIPSMSAAYGSVPKQDLPMATTSLNIVQRLGGPTLTTICATFLASQLGAAHSAAGVGRAFMASFLLLCGLHALQVLAAARLPCS
jgi:predicted MFS family arabinose efflux permease